MAAMARAGWRGVVVAASGVGRNRASYAARPARVTPTGRCCRSAVRPAADDVIMLPGIGAASLDLLVQTSKQTDVVHEHASAILVNPPDAGKATRDIDGVYLATAGTFDLMICHSSTPFLPVAARRNVPPARWSIAHLYDPPYADHRRGELVLIDAGDRNVFPDKH
jgi:hypothetical protein